MTVSFNKEFYPVSAIKKAVVAYKELADFKIEEKEKRIRVEIENIDQEVKGVIGDEFCNYALAETKKSA